MNTIYKLPLSLIRYSIAAFTVGGSLLITVWLWPVLQGTPAILFFAAVTFNAWYGGFSTGLFTSLFSVICLYYLFFEPSFFKVGHPLAHLTQLIVFVAVSIFVISLSEARRRAEEKLRKQEEQLRIITDVLPTPIFYVDRLGCYRFLNRTWEEWFGYYRNEVIGKPLTEILKETYSAISPYIETALSGKVTYSEREIFWEGRERYVRTDWIPHFGKNGEVLGFVGLMNDLTERKQNERVLEKERDFIDRVLSTVNSLVIVLDPQGCIVRFNEACEKITGYQFVEIKDRYFFDIFFSSADKKYVIAAFNELIDGKTPQDFENSWLTKNGEKRLISGSNTVIFNSDGKPEYVIGTGIDITERRQTENALSLSYSRLEMRVQERTEELNQINEALQAEIRERQQMAEALSRSEQYFKAVVENTPDIIIRVDREFRYLYVNPAVERFQGMPASAIVGKTSQELGVSSDLCELWEKTLQVVFATSREQIIEYSVPLTDGSRTFQSRIVPELNGEGKTEYALIVARDITELKQVEAQQSLLLAEQTARAKAEAEQQRSAFMAQASQTLASSLDYETTLKQVGKLAVPILADGCYIDIVEEDGTVRRLSATHADPSKIELFTEVERRYPTPPDAPHGYQLVLRTGEPELIPEITQEMLAQGVQDEAHLEMLRSLNLGSHLCVPLMTRRRVLGAITFVTLKSGRRYTSEDLRVLEDLASRAALAVDNARLYREAQRALSQTAESFALIDSLLAVAPAGICFLDRDKRFIRINAVLAELNGLPIEAHLGQKFSEILPECAELFEGLIQQVLETGEPLLNVDISGESKGKPGHFGYWLGNYYPVKDKDGTILGVGLILTEITETKRTEAALRESEAIFRRLFEANVFGVAIGDFSGRITYANDALLRMLGYTQDEMLAGQMHWDRLTPAEYRLLDELATQEVRTTGVATPFEKEYIRKDGSRVPILATGALLEGPSKGPEESVIGFYIDLTQIKQVEAELKKNQERLQLAQLAGEIGTFEWNIQTGLVTWTEELEALYGLPPGSYDGQYETWLQRVHPDDRAYADRAIRGAVSMGGQLDTEFRICWPDGSIRWIAAKGTVFYSKTGEPQRTIGVNMDISDRKRAEEALAETNQTLEALIQACPLAITVFSVDEGIVKMWNPAAERIFGWSEEEAKDNFLPSVPEEKREEFKANLQVIRDGQTLTAVETRRHRKDGSAIDISVWATPVLDAKGTINCLSIVADISDRKQAEQERTLLLNREQAARAEAETMNRMKDEFLAALSHELRTPLNAILGWSQLLRSRKFNETTIGRALETIERQARVQAQLVEDLLDVSRIIQGKLCLKVGWFNLQDVIETAMNSVSLMAQTKSISLEAEIDPAVERMWGDPERLQQVVWNLLSNAIKFTPAGGQVEISLSAASEPSGNGYRPGVNYAQIQVRDTGKGITPEFLPYVFERFRQGDGSLTKAYGGLGLGLAIVRHLVELHGGTVTAESDGEGKGATFTVQLPVRSMGNQMSPDAIEEYLPAEFPEPFELGGLQVLVVEDEVDTREFLTTMLEEYRATVIAVGSVKEAIAALEHWQPDILVSDIGLPAEDGYSLIRQVRMQDTNYKYLPAVALTAYAREQDRSQALEAGFDAHIPKPVEPLQLLTILNQLIDWN